jgi:hypothetical protein
VRNPEKLTKLLESHDIFSKTITSHLTIITGNVKTPADVSRTILPSTQIIVSGIGATPAWKRGDLLPSIDDPIICQNGTSTILEVLQSRQSPVKPLLVVISTTGISKFGRDIPLAMVPLYHWLLSVPHKDKKVMEEMVITAVEGEHAAIGEYAIIRPSLLTNGDGGKVRAEVEDGNIAKGAVGYTISRKDVGRYIFEGVVQKYTGLPKGNGKIVSITY